MPTSTHPYVRWLADKTTDELKDLMTVRLTSLRRNGYGPICGCCRFVAAFCDRYLALSRISEHFSTLRRPWLIARMQK